MDPLERMKAIRERAGLTSTGGWSIEDRAAAYNSRRGELTGYDCQKCRNKGHVMILQDGCEYMVECDCMDIRRSIQRIANSGLADVLEQYRLDNFTAETGHHRAMKDMAEDFLQTDTGWLFIGGQVGAGKTHICTAVCAELMKQGKSVRYIIWPEEVTRLKAIKMKEEEYAVAMNELKRFDVLYIDDFCKKQAGVLPTSADVDIAVELINSLYLQNSKRVIFSSERTVREITEEIDQGLGSRIYQKCDKHNMTISRDMGKNYRLHKED